MSNYETILRIMIMRDPQMVKYPLDQMENFQIYGGDGRIRNGRNLAKLFDTMWTYWYNPHCVFMIISYCYALKGKGKILLIVDFLFIYLLSC